MSTTITFYIRTSHAPSAIEEVLRAQLRLRKADPDRYYIYIHPPDPEDREGGRDDFGVEPTVVASIQPPRGEADFDLSGAALAMVRATGSEMVALHDYTPLFSYRDGVLHLEPEDRAVWEKHILPGYTGRVEYGKVLPWMEA